MPESRSRVQVLQRVAAPGMAIPLKESRPCESLIRSVHIVPSLKPLSFTFR